MWRFALRTVKARAGSHVASGLVMLAGTALLAAFSNLFETGLATADGNRGVLVLLPAILGGWTVAIVAFGVVSTVSLAVQQREREMALLRSIAATPRQVRQLIMTETLIIAFPVVLLGLLPGRLLGVFVLQRLSSSGAVTGPVALHAGWLAAGIAAAVSLIAAGAGALIAGRKAAAIAPIRALAETDVPTTVLPRARFVAGIVLVAIGLSMSVSTLFMANGPLLSSTAGPAGVATAVGLALLSPSVVAMIGRLTSAIPGPTGLLAGRSLRMRAPRHAAAIGPLVLLVGIATGTLYMQSTEDGTASSGPQFATVNYLVVAMIIAFASIAVINSLVSATRHRFREFGLLRLTGATSGQVLAMTAVESVLMAGIATFLGTVAALTTTIPFSLVRSGSPVAIGPVWMYPMIVAGALALAMVPCSVVLSNRS